MSAAIAALVGLIYAAFLEWGVHRFVFHGLGLKRGSRFAFHWREHHRASRRGGGLDPAFRGSPFAWNAHGREVWGLMALAVLHLPLAWLAPGAYAAMVAYGAAYHAIHRKSHQDPAWAERWVPWHVDHHMGSDQHANYGVVTDWVDRLMGTRVERRSLA